MGMNAPMCVCIKIVCMVDTYLTASQLGKYLPFFTSISVLSVRSFSYA